tara:strand:- start:575 stop:1921 length:1347 start_codon:yes stop_codon:yes gene_type:complete
MATKNIVPNADGEGKLGTSSKSWAEGHIDSITGTIATAAQGSITSLGTLTALNLSGNVKIGTSTTVTPATQADDIVIDKGASESGITIVSTAAASLRFGDAASASVGFIEYNHSSNAFSFGTNGGTRLTIASGGDAAFSGNIEIPNDGTIGSEDTANAIKITSSGEVEFTGANHISGASSLRAQAKSGNLFLDTSASAQIRTNGTTTALTLDTSQNATFANDIILPQDGVVAFNSVSDEYITATASNLFFGVDNGYVLKIDGANDRVEVRDGHDLRLDDGDLIINTAGHGINFSATSDGSGMSAEVFDDYEEGSWTPRVTDGTDVAQSNGSFTRGDYTKIGRLVHCSFQIVLTDLTSSGGGEVNGSIRMDGFPFANRNVQGAQSGGVIGAASHLNITAGHSVSLVMRINVAEADFSLSDSSGGTTDMQASEFSDDGQCKGTISYMTDS